MQLIGSAVQNYRLQNESAFLEFITRAHICNTPMMVAGAGPDEAGLPLSPRRS